MTPLLTISSDVVMIIILVLNPDTTIIDWWTDRSSVVLIPVCHMALKWALSKRRKQGVNVTWTWACLLLGWHWCVSKCRGIPRALSCFHLPSVCLSTGALCGDQSPPHMGVCVCRGASVTLCNVKLNALCDRVYSVYTIVFAVHSYMYHLVFFLHLLISFCLTFSFSRLSTSLDVSFSLGLSLSLSLSHLLLPQIPGELSVPMAFCLAELHLWSTKSSLQVKGNQYFTLSLALFL